MLLSFSPSASTDEWNKTYNLETTPTVRVRTSDANIHVTSWESRSVSARVTTKGWEIGGDGINIVEHQSGGTIDIEVRFPRHVFQVNWGNRQVDIEIKLPHDANIDLNTGDGNVDVQGISGAAVVRSGDGNLELSEMEGSLQAHTGDGNIDMRNLRGNLNMRTGDGRIEATGIDGSLRAETGDGRIRVSGRFDLLDVRTGDGGVEASALSGSKLASNWQLSTGDGDLTLRLQESIAADVELKTSDGDIELGIPVTLSGRAGKHDVRGQINGGGKLLSLKTGDGSIRLEKL